MRTCTTCLAAIDSARAGQTLIHFGAIGADHVRNALAGERENLAGSKWRESVRGIGVRKPVDLLPIRVSHADGRPQVDALAAIDGSSRMFLCHEALGLDSADVLYRLTGRPPRRPHVHRTVAAAGPAV